MVGLSVTAMASHINCGISRDAVPATAKVSETDNGFMVL